MNEVVFTEQNNGSFRGSWIDPVTQKRKFKLLKNPKAAEAWNRERKAGHAAHGRLAASIETPLVSAWAKYDENLKEVGSSLAEVADEALKRLLAVKCEGTAEKCLTEFLNKKTFLGKSPRYVGDLRKKVNAFLRSLPKGEKTEMKHIATLDIKNYLDQLKSGQIDRDNHERNIGGWIRWAAFAGWTGISMPPKPPKGSKARKNKKGVAKIYHPHEVASLLRAAVESGEWTILSALAVGLFAGIRPEAEFYKKINEENSGMKKLVTLKWEDFHEEGIDISAELAKTRNPRVVPIQPVLDQWISFIREKRGGTLTGPVTYSNFISDLAAWKKINLPKLKLMWHHDVLRHCFGTYRLCTVKSLSVLAEEMGNSPAIIEDHYKNWTIRQSQAIEFWGLTPDKILSDNNH